MCVALFPRLPYAVWRMATDAVRAECAAWLALSRRVRLLWSTLVRGYLCRRLMAADDTPCYHALWRDGCR